MSMAQGPGEGGVECDVSGAACCIHRHSRLVFYCYVGKLPETSWLQMTQSLRGQGLPPGQRFPVKSPPSRQQVPASACHSRLCCSFQVLPVVNPSLLNGKSPVFFLLIGDPSWILEAVPHLPLDMSLNISISFPRATRGKT